MLKLIPIVIIAFFVFNDFALSEETRLLRYPNSSEDQVAFSYAGDIYSVPIGGGLARRLTSSEGIEIYPRFSPDGRTIAISAEYDGNREIYTIPAEGGAPTRLTYSMDVPGAAERMGPDKVIMQWSDNGSKILYRARKDSWNPFIGSLYFISNDGGMPEELPLPRGGFASLSPDGNKIAYNKIFREYRTWKRYKGGMADDIWIYDFGTKEIVNITDNDAQDIIPMWHKDKIYYVSDREGKMNMYSYTISTKQTKKVTDFKEYDVKFPSLGAKHIAFENAGYIYLLDLSNDQVKKISIEVRGDFPSARASIIKVNEKINQYEISPDGKRALFSSRGDIFTVPAKKGNIRNLTKTTGVHERAAVWSPNGKWIAYISDESGEDEVYIMKPDGADKIQLTNGSKSYRYSLKWSPDSKKLLCSDKALKLNYIDIASKKTVNITTSEAWEIRDYQWSPDSKWVAYTDQMENGSSVVYLYSLEDNSSKKVTDEFFSSFGPVFDPNGKYLFYVSNRTFNPSLGFFEMSYIYSNMSKIYGLTLQDTLPTPFAFESDEVEIIEDETKKKSKKKKKDEESALRIDLDNIKDRLFELPVEAGNYGGLRMTGSGKLYYVKSTKSKKPALMMYDFNDRKEDEVGSIRSYEISDNEKFILFRKGKDYYIEKLAAKVKADKGKLKLDDMKVYLDRREEWQQIFDEAWRQMRDFFYAPNMHGVDWKKMHKRYSALLPYVNHRADLTYIIGEMIGELNVGHAYVGGGDMPKTEKVAIGLLGAEFELDKRSGYYKITKILSGRNWDEKTRSPLTEPGIEINEGDFLIAVDGQKLSKDLTPFMALVNKAGKYVTLTVNSKASPLGADEYTVKTIATESGLRYFNWVENNRRIVEEATSGKVGYVHIPNMMFEGLNEFVKYFYPQIRKEAIIIDDRFNGGGFVSQMIIERLRRVLTMVGNARNQKVVSTYPDAVFTGPMVCLLNELSASDGDIFPYNFKQNNLGKLIGKRSWGGVIGIRGSLPLLDGSYLFKPEFSHFSTDGKWILEGVGMEPDIEIDNNPGLEYEGTDEQLNKAIEVILEELKNYKQPKIPEIPDYPVRN